VSWKIAMSPEMTSHAPSANGKTTCARVNHLTSVLVFTRWPVMPAM
jgi:hypothetical protein